MRQWLAERFNPERFGSRAPSVAVSMNVGALMLDALRQPRPSRPLASTRSLPSPALKLLAPHGG
jgi:hypothetical protein